MKRIWATLLIAVVVLMGCSDTDPAGDGETAPSPAAAESPVLVTPNPQASPIPSPTFGHAKVLIDTGDSSVIVDAEKAETPVQRQVGLMYRESLPEDGGMVFLFFEEVAAGFWMHNVKIPLSVAFFAADGEIVKILDMEPCKKMPCEIYDPLYDDGRAVTYVGALEVNQGAFERWGVEEGDRITVSH